MTCLPGEAMCFRLADFDLLVFDMDGVLVDTSRCHSRAYKDLWSKIGINGPSYEIIAGRKTTEVIAWFTRQFMPSALQVKEWVVFKQQQARKYLTTQTIIYSDTFLSLAALSKAGIPLAVGTGASRPTAEFVLKRLGLVDLFTSILTAEDVLKGKPEPEVYLQIMTRAFVSPTKTLIIEDSRAGLQAAVASGAYVASVRTGYRLNHERFIGAFVDLRTLTLALGINTL